MILIPGITEDNFRHILIARKEAYNLVVNSLTEQEDYEKNYDEQGDGEQDYDEQDDDEHQPADDSNDSIEQGMFPVCSDPDQAGNSGSGRLSKPGFAKR